MKNPRFQLPSLFVAVLVAGCSGGSSDGGAGGAGGGSAGTPRSDGGTDASAGGSSGAGGAAGNGGGGSGGVFTGVNLPQFLSETGLYSDIAMGTVAPDVAEYQPRWTLWSDSATKRRWMKIPAGEQIDTSDMDFWSFPVGMQVWKEFTRDGVRVETRLLEKTADGWEMVSYEWNPEQTEAEIVPFGNEDVQSTPHDIPSTGDCSSCHEKTGDVLISVSALMLAHDLPGVTLQQLIDDGRLSSPPPSGTIAVPGDDVAQTAVGYLHANCGACHNSTSELFENLPMDFWLRTDQLGSLEETPVWQTAVGQRNPRSQLFTIDPGSPDTSLLINRMSMRGVQQMPPVGTEDVDDDGVAEIRAWISSLSADGGAPDGGSLDGGADAADGS